jgi:hypothetical protein
MSRYRRRGSYNHWVRRMGHDWFRIGWTLDYYYTGSRLRFPRGFNRDTDFAGARRFAKHWNLPAPMAQDGEV